VFLASPDGSENPFVFSLKTKDCIEQQALCVHDSSGGNAPKKNRLLSSNRFLFCKVCII